MLFLCVSERLLIHKGRYNTAMNRGRFLVVLLLGFFALTANAQSIGTDPLTVSISPTYPAPYQTVTITPSSTLFDIAGATVTIVVNGKAFYKGSGGTSVQVPVGGAGSATTIKVSAVSGGQATSKTLTIRPADVALVVEPISTTHPFYGGPGLVAANGRVRVIAIPDVRTSSNRAIDPANLEYTWKLGAQVLQNDSGIGKSVLDATAPERYRDADVSVTVSSSDGTLNAQAHTNISPVDPIARMYRNDPLLGPLFDVAVPPSITMAGTEDSYRGVAYYFSSPPSLSWAVNGVANGTDKDITVRSAGSGTGSAVLNFTANQEETSQTANTTVSVNFGQKKSGFLGL
jgi:hypothetical protein